SWASMAGDDRERFCTHCRQQVFNLSGMRREEAEDLVRGRWGRLCVRYYRRADGTVMTRDWPVGVRRPLRRPVALGLALLPPGLVRLGAWACLASGDRSGRAGARLRDREPFRTLLDWLDPSPPPVMGAICPVPPPDGQTDPGVPAGPPPEAEEGR